MDDAVRLGAMLYTLVDPNKGHEVAYNRWYERDHFYGGCMIGPWLFAGSRWVATRAYKDLRFPADSSVAVPVDAGSYVAVYWVHKGHEAEHFEWSTKQVFDLYEHGRGFDERTHAHTALYTYQGTEYRDDDPVPVELALDHRYRGLVSVHVDRAEGVKHPAFDEWFAAEGRALMLDDDSPFAMAASWRPIIPRVPEGQQAPMELGSGPGTPARSLQLFFSDEDPATVWDRVRDYGAAIDASGVATVRLAAPFIPTVIGTDTYTDQLW
ncbi:MAG TPA: hypothetical protein VJM33_00300 [Microthrixaceae bacterium]|nr:hypothetical protein [Microthrixaceae bacterium]